MLIEELVYEELRLDGVTFKWTSSFWENESKKNAFSRPFINTHYPTDIINATVPFSASNFVDLSICFNRVI